jgi:hypothetical protein
MTGARPTTLLLVLLACITSVSACGDAQPQRSAGTTPPAQTGVGRPEGTSSDEYPGTFASAKEVCGSVPRERVAANVHSRSTAPSAVARAFASGYKPRLRVRAYRGCLAGLH